MIENVDLLAVEGESAFGNGVEVAVVNEAGGREIPIYDNLSAHTAYVIAFYRHRPKVIENLKKMIGDYARVGKKFDGGGGQRFTVDKLQDYQECQDWALRALSREWTGLRTGR